MGRVWGQQGIHELDSKLHGAEVGALQLGLLQPDAIVFFQAMACYLQSKCTQRVEKWCLPLPPYVSAS